MTKPTPEEELQRIVTELYLNPDTPVREITFVTLKISISVWTLRIQE